MFLFYKHKDTPFFFTYRLTGRLITGNIRDKTPANCLKKHFFSYFSVTNDIALRLPF